MNPYSQQLEEQTQLSGAYSPTLGEALIRLVDTKNSLRRSLAVLDKVVAQIIGPTPEPAETPLPVDSLAKEPKRKGLIHEFDEELSALYRDLAHLERRLELLSQATRLPADGQQQQQ